MCGYNYIPNDPIRDINNLAKTNNIYTTGSKGDSKGDNNIEQSSALFWETYGLNFSSLGQGQNSAPPLIKANNYICTTATKAYGRLYMVDKALGLLQWFEKGQNYDLSYKGQNYDPSKATPNKNNIPDIYFLTALLYVCATNKQIKQAEHIFWTEIPARNLTYTVATTNSIMYMYARQNRPDDALRVYDMTKKLGLKCTVVTYGVLIKALLRSGRKNLQDASYDILRSLPEIGIGKLLQSIYIKWTLIIYS